MDHFLHQLVTKLSDLLVSHEVQHLLSLTLSHLNLLENNSTQMVAKLGSDCPWEEENLIC